MRLVQLPPPNLSVRVDQYTERSEGLHHSRIVHDILCTLDPERYDDREGGPNWMNFLSGLILERAFELAWLDKEISDGHRPELIRPGEIKYDGIIVTPDAYDTMMFRPEEYKCTKKSCRQDITDKKFWQYWVQLKAQAMATGSDSGVLWVMFINGNYNRSGVLADGSIDPDSGWVIRGWEAYFTQLEKEENWAMLTNHAKSRGWR